MISSQKLLTGYFENYALREIKVTLISHNSTIAVFKVCALRLGNQSTLDTYDAQFERLS